MTAHPKNHLREGIELFNRERFFECHEVLEEAWLKASSEGSGEQRTFLQGLIQVAVAFYHLRRENLVGASRLLTAGIKKLSGFAPERDAVDVAALLAALEPLREAAAAGTIRPDCRLPRIVTKNQPLPSSPVPSSE